MGDSPVTTPDSVSLDVPVDSTERTLMEATPRHIRTRWKITKTPSRTGLEGVIKYAPQRWFVAGVYVSCMFMHEFT